MSSQLFCRLSWLRGEQVVHISKYNVAGLCELAEVDEIVIQHVYWRIKKHVYIYINEEFGLFLSVNILYLIPAFHRFSKLLSMLLKCFTDAPVSGMGRYGPNPWEVLNSEDLSWRITGLDLWGLVTFSIYLGVYYLKVSRS